MLEYKGVAMSSFEACPESSKDPRSIKSREACIQTEARVRMSHQGSYRSCGQGGTSRVAPRPTLETLFFLFCPLRYIFGGSNG